ncbi:hypothetical protein [Alicyclobacillus contaminans]|uniref:hypothetical protein n=1 Tax=Alicyclobacillus contaminans TaxID=392016 RepID=UPI00041F18AB|nr:hypothetical protein [Alicyclobacillus contaminans]
MTRQAGNRADHERRLAKWDRHLIQWTKNHTNLLLLLVNLIILIWTCFVGMGEYLLGMVVIGALGYFAGLTVSISAVPIAAAVDVLWLHHTHAASGTIMVELVGYVNIAWLGYRHQRLKQTQQRAITEAYPDQVMSWNAVNEIRSSLAAIRFLLFPLHSEHANNKELQQATNELSRLEKMFQEMEHQQTYSEGRRND